MQRSGSSNFNSSKRKKRRAIRIYAQAYTTKYTRGQQYLQRFSHLLRHLAKADCHFEHASNEQLNIATDAL